MAKLDDYCKDIAKFRVEFDGKSKEEHYVNLKKFNAPNSAIYVLENPNYKGVYLKIQFENKNETGDIKVMGENCQVSNTHEVKILPKGVKCFVLRFKDVEEKMQNDEKMKFSINITGMSIFNSPSFEIMRIKYSGNLLKGEDLAIYKEVKSLVFEKQCSYDDKFRGEEFECLINLRNLDYNLTKKMELRSEVTSAIASRRGSYNVKTKEVKKIEHEVNNF